MFILLFGVCAILFIIIEQGYFGIQKKYKLRMPKGTNIFIGVFCIVGCFACSYMSATFFMMMLLGRGNVIWLNILVAILAIMFSEGIAYILTGVVFNRLPREKVMLWLDSPSC